MLAAAATGSPATAARGRRGNGYRDTAFDPGRRATPPAAGGPPEVFGGGICFEIGAPVRQRCHLDASPSPPRPVPLRGLSLSVGVEPCAGVEVDCRGHCQETRSRLAGFLRGGGLVVVGVVSLFRAMHHIPGVLSVSRYLLTFL